MESNCVIWICANTDSKIIPSYCRFIQRIDILVGIHLKSKLKYRNKKIRILEIYLDGKTHCLKPQSIAGYKLGIRYYVT